MISHTSLCLFLIMHDEIFERMRDAVNIFYRVFHICTTRKSVYPKDKLLIAMDKEKQEIPGFCSPGSATMISPRYRIYMYI